MRLKKFFYTLLICLFGFSSAGFAAELKLGFVNAAKILEEAPQAEAARNKLEKEFAPRDKNLVASQKEVKDMEDKLAKDGAVISEAERRKSERDILTQKRDLKRAQDEFREDFNIRRNEEFGKLQRLVYETIVSLAKQDGYDLIVGDGAIYASDRVDITDKVLQRLKSGKSEPAPSKDDASASPKQ
ncbi:MAG TPA: OmpH family outer membrane protein [Gammaproteobacteria bacterium]|nr:OmpH family outer membrane protein [Gammaproteobacteria bacterium]